MGDTQIAVLGSGIAGCLTACMLVDRGYDVVLVDRHPEPMSAASRWNEGKIHLGFTYVGTGSLATARLMIDGAAVFEELIEQVTGSVLPQELYTAGVVYLVDPDSQFSPEVLLARTRAIADCIEAAAATSPGLARYLGRGPLVQELTLEDAAQSTGVERIQAAWRTRERAIAPGAVAERLRAAVAARAVPRVRGEVTSVHRHGGGWAVTMGDQVLHACSVVNSTWESRALLDRGLFPAPAPVSIRFKYSLFGRGLNQLAARLAPSTRILGRFGDITPYGNGEAYVSWYPAGLAGLSDDGTPPPVQLMDPARVVAETLAGLGLDESLLELPSAAWSVEGGYVVAHGNGDIDHAASPLHDRSRPGAFELAPGYVSVDTGKYSLGPLVAQQAVALIEARLGSRMRRLG